MQKQLQRIYSQTLQQFDHQQLRTSQPQQFFPLFGIQQHLKTKALELQRLQQCFQDEIKQIQNYQIRQRKYKEMIKVVLSSLCLFKSNLADILKQWSKMRLWKEEVESNIKLIPEFIYRIVREKSQREGEQELIKSKVEVNQQKFHKIQMGYREQIQKQNKLIIQLEQVLKRKSQAKQRLSETSSNLSVNFNGNGNGKGNANENVNNNQKKLQRQRTSISLKPQNLQLSSNYNNTNPLKDMSQYKNTNHNNSNNKSIDKSSVSPARKISQKILSKEEVVEKIRKYKQSKTIKQNYDILQRKASVIQKKTFQIPSLPELKILQNYKSPIMTGFDVLVIEGKEVYKGMWRKGVFQGRGKYYSGNWIYDGDFKNGIIDGFGTINFQGYTFIGKFQNGKAQGQGTLYMKQKPISGIWRDNILIKQY